MRSDDHELLQQDNYKSDENVISFLRLTRVKTASALFWDSPYHLSTIEEILKLINLAPKRQTG